MKKQNLIVVSVAILGLLIGLTSSFHLKDEPDSTYCDSLQQQIKSNQSFNGSVACYPPGVIDVNISDKVDKNTNLRCVCRIISSSGTQIFPIAVSK
ncbi:MAG: hypothetical protein BRC26_01005 [Nanohaloarchaea archaeon QH_8_44_6]|nr:MAG: hypothetical protein BRC26_01005 [Nanohaloarchaea archaeon QH_8_44_6]